MYMGKMGLGYGLRNATATAAAALLAMQGGFGLAIFSRDNSMSIRDASTPANDYSGAPSGKLTTTRASSATYWNSSGVLTLASSNELRRDFDPRLSSTVERCGYLIEEARTNLALRSEAFDNASWTKTETTVTADQAVAPDGLSTADLVVPSTNSTAHAVGQAITHTVASYSFSVFVKSAGYSKVGLRENTTIGAYASFNLSGAGSVISSTAASSSIQLVGNGWYRVSITYTGSVAAETMRVYVLDAAYTSGVINSYNYVGDGTSGIYLWGAQDELGSFASSYIPTTTASVTRAADLVTLAGTLFPLSQTEGTLYAKFMPQGVTANSINALSLNDNTTSEFHVIGRGTNRTAIGSTYDGGSPQTAFASTATIADLAQGKVAAAYKLNDSAAAMIGETVQTDIICTMPTTTQMVFGTFNSGTNRTINGWLFEAAYFPTRKTNSQLQALASGYASDALLLMGAETQGLTFSATDQSMSILDTGTPANNYTGELSAKLGSIRTSAGMTYLSSRLLGWGPENLLLRSQEFDNASWTKDSGVSVTADQIAAPDGTMTADMITDAGTAASSMRVYQLGTLGPLDVVTFSVYAKQGSGRYILISSGGTRVTGSGGSGADRVCVFDLQTQTVTNTSFYTTAITALPNGWCRCSITLTCDSDAGTDTASFYVKQTTSPTSLVLPAASQTVYLWGAQLERAASASTYKPTTSAAYYGLRLDYDSRLTGGPGYLVEEARTNLVTQSNTLTNAAWTATRSSVAATETGMDGTTSAFFLKEDGTAASSHHLYNFNSITVVASTNYCLSAIVKQKTGTRRVRISCDVAAFTSGFDGTFNFASPANPTTGFYGTGTVVSSGYQDLGNGYYRIWVVGTLPSTSAVVGAYLHDGSGVSYNGDNASGISIERFQFELGSFPTSIIPTTTATVTRAADLPPAQTALPIGTVGHTLVAKVNRMIAGSNNSIMQVNDGTGGNVISASLQSGDPRFGSVVASATQAFIDGGTAATPPANDTLAGGAELDNFALSHNGAAAVTDVLGTIPTVDRLYLGVNASGVNSLNGWLRHGRYFPTRKSNADLAVLAAAA